MSSEERQKSLAKVKVPSSPREFFAKIYGSSTLSSTSGQDIVIKESQDSVNFSEDVDTEEAEGDRVQILEEENASQMGMMVLPASSSFLTAAAAVHWNWVQQYLRSSANRKESFGHEEQSLSRLDILAVAQFNHPHSQAQPTIPPALNNFLARKRRRDGRIRRQRTTFSHDQTLSLELEFQRAEYISRTRRCELAQGLRLTETQIKIWFQNRRAKDKRLEKAQLDHQQVVFNILNGYQNGRESDNLN